MKTCKNCIHWKVCKHIVYEYDGEYAASAYDEDSCCKAFAETCENYIEIADFIREHALKEEDLYKYDGRMFLRLSEQN